MASLRARGSLHASGPARSDVASIPAIAATEVAVLYAILRPWSYHRSWMRSALAALLFAPLSVVALAAESRAHLALTVHALWLLLLELSLVITTLVSVSSRRRFGPARRRAKLTVDSPLSAVNRR